MALFSNKKRTFFTDIWRKIFALLLGILAWFAINKQVREQSPEREITIPLNLLCDDAKVILPDEKPKIKLRYRTTLDMKKISSNDFKVFYKIAETADSIPPEEDKGLYVNINNTDKFNFNCPRFTEIVSYEINERILIDKLKKKSVPIHINVNDNGELKHGMFSFFESSPKYLELEGAAATLSKLKCIETEPVKLDEIKVNTPFKVNMKPLPQHIRIISTLPEEGIRATMQKIDSRHLQTKEYEHIPLRILSARQQDIVPENVATLEAKVTLTANISTLNELQDPKLYIDISDIQEIGKHTVPVKLYLPTELNDTIIKMEILPPAIEVKFVPAAKHKTNGDAADAKK